MSEPLDLSADTSVPPGHVADAAAEEKWMRILNIAGLGFWEIDDELSTLYLSQQVYDLWGLDKKLFKPTYENFIATIYEDDRAAFVSNVDKSFKEGVGLDTEYRVIDPKGNMKVICQKGAIQVATPGSRAKLQSTIQDITARKQEEQAMMASEEKYYAIFDLSPLPQWIYSLGTFRVLAVNQAAIDHYGFTRDEFLQKTVMDIRQKEDVEKLMTALKAPLSGIQHFGHCRHVKADGSIIHVDVSGHPITYNKIPSLVIIAKDITKEISASVELRVANKRLEAAQEIAKLGYWQHDFVKNETYWSEEMYRIFDYDKTGISPGLDAALARMPSHEHSMLQEAIAEAKLKGGRYEVVHHVITREGEEKTVRGKGRYLYDDQGELIMGSGTIQDITVVRKIQVELEANRKELQLIYDTVGDGIFLLERKTKDVYEFVTVNKCFVEATGYKASFVIGKTLGDLVPGKLMPPLLDMIHRAIEEKQSKKWEQKLDYPTGIRYGIITITPMFNEAGEADRILGSIHDVTNIRLTAAQLFKSNQRFEYAARTTSDAIWDWDLVTDSLYWGDGFERLTGYKLINNRGDIALWIEHLHPDERNLVLDSINNSLNGIDTSWKMKYRYRHKHGNYLNIADRGIILRDKSGKAYRMIGAMQDVTQLEESESLLQSMNERLAERAEELAESNNELERFAYVASHDLQEPLRMITGFLQLLEKKYSSQLDDTASRYIHFAVDGAERMRGLIHDLLEYSRIGTNMAFTDETNMNAVVEEVLRLYRNAIDEGKAVITVGELPVIPNSSRIQMLQLMQNLVGNALKYNDKPLARLNISCVVDAGNWKFSISDNGIGIGPEFLEKVFDIFQRLQTRSEYSGTGIGLAICKKIVERHGGKIWIESEAGNGTVFYFTLPKTGPA